MTTMISIDDIALDVLDNLAISEYRDTAAPSAEEKREARLTVGQLLLKARAKHTDDKSFGDWCRSDIIEKCPTKLSTKTLYRYRLLAEFVADMQSPSACVKAVGVTTIYKLMEGENTDLRKWVQENWDKVPKVELTTRIKQESTGDAEVPTTAQQSPVQQMIAAMAALSEADKQLLREALGVPAPAAAPAAPAPAPTDPVPADPDTPADIPALDLQPIRMTIAESWEQGQIVPAEDAPVVVRSIAQIQQARAARDTSVFDALRLD